MYNHSCKLLFESICFSVLVKIFMWFVIFQSSLWIKINGEKWINFPSKNDKRNKLYEFTFPVQYTDYNHQHEKWNFLNGLPENKTFRKHDYYTLKFQKTIYLIDLIQNTVLLPESFAVTTFTSKGNRQTYKPTTSRKLHCYYQGHVRGIKKSKVVVSTCNGLKGTITLPKNAFMIKPFSNGTHAIYQLDLKSSNISQRFCGTTFYSNNSTFSYVNARSNLLQLKQVTVGKRFVELFIVTDQRTFRRHQYQLTGHVKEVANNIDSLYVELNIRVILSHIEIWNKDKISITNDIIAEKLLNLFFNYRIEQIKTLPDSSPWVYADAVHLIYGGDFSGKTLGLARLGSMCKVDAAGVVQDDSIPDRVGSVMAHELGHNFGMMHVEDVPGCKCFATECIMTATTSYGRPLGWSSCSRQLLRNTPTNIDVCLLTPPEPSRYIESSVCGNDIVEENEECDCGLSQYCSGNCCNPLTCKLTEGSKCNSGDCCDKCEIVNKTVVCRRANDECDLPEYCDGISPYCPRDLYKEDGVGCRNNAATCSRGFCLDDDGQCQLVFDKSAQKAPRYCYELNQRGLEGANCGVDKYGNYIKCLRKNINCGTLHCSFQSAVSPVASAVITLTINSIYKCKSIVPNKGFPGYDYVFDGTRCSHDKICLGKICQVSRLCSQSCNRHGICNNIGQCHCDAGWAPPNCKHRIDGPGGMKPSFNNSSAPNGNSFINLVNNTAEKIRDYFSRILNSHPVAFGAITFLFVVGFASVLFVFARCRELKKFLCNEDKPPQIYYEPGDYYEQTT